MKWLEALTQREVIDIVFDTVTQYPTEIYAEWGNIKRDLDADRPVFYLTQYDHDSFQIEVNIRNTLVCMIKYGWSGGSNSHMINLRIYHNDGTIQEFTGICIRDHRGEEPMINWWDRDGIKKCRVDYVYDFMNRIYDNLYTAMEDKWKLLHVHFKSKPDDDNKETVEATPVTTVIPIFDRNVVDMGSLIQLHVLKRSVLWTKDFMKVGDVYNAFVRKNAGTKLELILVDQNEVHGFDLDIHYVTDEYIKVVKLA